MGGEDKVRDLNKYEKNSQIPIGGDEDSGQIKVMQFPHPQVPEKKLHNYS